MGESVDSTAMDSSRESWHSHPEAVSKIVGVEQVLFDRHELTKFHAAVYLAVREARNLPEIAPEQLVWATAVASIGASEGDQNRIAGIVEDRVRQLKEADSRYGWLHGEWTHGLMSRLVKTWCCGLMIVDPQLVSKTGELLQWTHEYYGDEYYPNPEDQTEDWKEESMRMFALMIRSIVRAYPTATTKGIVSFSDMIDFSWAKYDMDTKRRNSEVNNLIPLKFVRMISVRPDEKMRQFFEQMGPRMLKKWGFVAYDNYESAVAGEGSILPPRLPSFVGGNHRVDVLKCLKALFRTEPEALQLCLDVFAELQQSGQLPCPKHMR